MTPGLVVGLTVNAPANGTHFVAGEQMVINIELSDGFGFPVLPTDLTAARLQLAGPKEALATRTAVALLGTTADRAASVHHYVDLRAASSRLVTSFNRLTFTTAAVSTEAPGTYLVGVYATSARYPIDQAFPVAEVQVGTATVEPDIVGIDQCASCHKGPMSNKFYFAHADPSTRSPTGSWAIDQIPVRTCKTCHNEEGYAAYCSDRTANPCPTASKVPDSIVRRVHGVHMGAQLRSAFDVDPTNGDFRDYADLVFPADIRRCTKCHADDRWASQPSRLACGSCHDAVNWQTAAISPRRTLGRVGSAACTTDAQCQASYNARATCDTASGNCLGPAVHNGGVQLNDAACALCHTPGPGISPTGDRHAIPAPNTEFNIALSMSAPGNGTHYVAESPVLTMAVSNKVTGAAVDPATMIEAAPWSRGILFVSGPRSATQPALTTAATGVAALRAEKVSASQPFDLTAPTDLQLTVDGNAITVNLASGVFANRGAATTAEVVAWLNADAGFAARATAVADVRTSAPAYNRVKIRSNGRGATSSVAITAGAGQAALGFSLAVAVPVVTWSYASNDLRLRRDPFDNDPRVTRTATQLNYQLGSVTGLSPGTYTVLAEFQQASTALTTVAVLNFQVGTATAEAKIATNCIDCHADTRMHGSRPFDTDVCKSCHDYGRQLGGTPGGVVDGWGASAAAGRGNFGFGAGPISRRVHGVHRLRYLAKPWEVHSTWDTRIAGRKADIIFPQDLRNCTKCHSARNDWRQNPSRLACLGCHDTDAAQGHGTLQTLDPTPLDPMSGDERETCDVCHGENAEFSVERVHSISNPYRPPYLREPTP